MSRPKSSDKSRIKVTFSEPRQQWVVVQTRRDGRRTTRFCRTRAEAEALANRRDGLLTVGDLLGEWLETRERQVHEDTLRRSSYEWYRRMVQVVERELGRVSGPALNRRDHLVPWVRRRLGEGRSPRSVAGEIKVLRLALHRGSQHGRWRGDLRTMFARLLEDGDEDAVVEVPWLRREEVLPFLDAIEDQCFRVAAELALDCGLRSGEIRTRQWRDWDPSTRRLRIGSKPEVGWRTKSGKSRVVTLSPEVGDLLKHWFQRLGRPGGDGWIVPARDGVSRQGWGSTLNDRTHAACARAGVRRVSFHGLRHAYASLALEAGVSPLVVSRTLGHHSVEFTMRMYGHVAEFSLDSAARTVRAYFTSCPAGEGQGEAACGREAPKAG